MKESTGLVSEDHICFSNCKQITYDNAELDPSFREHLKGLNFFVVTSEDTEEDNGAAYIFMPSQEQQFKNAVASNFTFESPESLLPQLFIKSDTVVSHAHNTEIIMDEVLPADSKYFCLNSDSKVSNSNSVDNHPSDAQLAPDTSSHQVNNTIRHTDNNSDTSNNHIDNDDTRSLHSNSNIHTNAQKNKTLQNNSNNNVLNTSTTEAEIIRSSSFTNAQPVITKARNNTYSVPAVFSSKKPSGDEHLKHNKTANSSCSNRKGHSNSNNSSFSKQKCTVQ